VVQWSCAGLSSRPVSSGVASDVTAAEVGSAPETVRELHQELLLLAGAVLPVTSQALALVAAYEARGILGQGIARTCCTSPWRPSPRSMRS